KVLPHQHCAHTSHHIKTCKALQAIVRPYVSQFCPTTTCTENKKIAVISNSKEVFFLSNGETD
ncbi:hypothetical protein, partial [Escherichia coli]|uniref:hypothetical protein n=1 Tax=Escherichia coli TaxID=562 RepID=UPI001BC8394C